MLGCQSVTFGREGAGLDVSARPAPQAPWDLGTWAGQAAPGEMVRGAHAMRVRWPGLGAATEVRSAMSLQPGDVATV